MIIKFAQMFSKLLKWWKVSNLSLFHKVYISLFFNPLLQNDDDDDDDGNEESNKYSLIQNNVCMPFFLQLEKEV